MELQDLFFLGWKLQYLKRAGLYNSYVKNENYIYDNLEAIENTFKKIDIDRDILNRILRMKKTLDRYEIDERITDNDGNDLNEMVEVLFAQLNKELKELTIFESVKDCVLDKQCLVKLMNKEKTSFFDEEVWDELSDIAKSDYSDAAKCLLMGASTPATMITLRAAEDVVRRYYENKTGNDFSEKVWGSIINELKNLPDINKDLIEHLDYIRKTRRNLAQHPDKIYNQREAERIFMEIISSTHDIYADMK